MTSRQAGRRISTIAAARRPAKRKNVGIRRNQTVSPREKRRVIQLVACGSIFVLLVAVKLLLPGRMAQINEKLSAALHQSMDVQAVFSALGKAVSGEETVGGAMGDVYQAVFHPDQEGAALETSAEISGGIGGTTALDDLRKFRESQASDTVPVQTEGDTPSTDATEDQSGASSLAYVLYSDRNLPENVNMEQAVLGFDYCTPVMGTLSSNFGYREHPIEGEERFHYGVDIAADAGTAIGCFADGKVTAVGESSSYGKYLIVEHSGGYSTLYAHCSRVTATSGSSVREGDKIAEVGETGMATGPHLHFEVHQDNTYLNPVYYVKLA